MIEQIYIDNFKSLKEVALQLPNMAFFCGPNGSGKSNFAEACDFLSQTFKNGLSYAVAEKGGFYNMCYRRQRRSRGAISFRFAGKLHSSRDPIKSVRYEAAFSLQTREEAIRSDFYVSSEWYSFEIETDAVRPSWLRVSREGAKYVLHKDVSEALVNAYNWLGKPIEDWWEFIKPQERELMYLARVAELLP
jgi:predicted ATPase